MTMEKNNLNMRGEKRRKWRGKQENEEREKKRIEEKKINSRKKEKRAVKTATGSMRSFISFSSCDSLCGLKRYSTP